MTKNVMIIGGGIAGPVTAMALREVGIDATVYEAYGHGSEGVGAFLTLAPNGVAALGLIGLADTVAGLGMPTPRMRLLNGKGRELVEFDSPSTTLKRADLYSALRDEALRRGVRVEYGKRLTDAAVQGGQVVARFADGSTAGADALIGADGLKSRVRTIIDPKAPSARHVGLLNTGGYARGVKVDAQVGVANFLFGKKCFFGYLLAPDGSVWWFANPPSKKEPTAQELAAITPEQWRSRLLELFAEDTPLVSQIIRATPEIMSGWNTYDFPTVPRWHNDRMIIIGDAAHATSPSAGQGASMAVEDAVVLAKCLRDLPTPAAAFAAFEQLRRERVEKVVKQGRRNGSGKAPGPVGRVFRDAFLPSIMRQVAKKNALGWITEHRIDWAARVSV